MMTALLQTRPIEHYDIAWRDIRVHITYKPDAFGSDGDHYHYSRLEVQSTQPDHPLPMTETGYRSQFLPAGEVENFNGPVAYVTCWLDSAARSRAWKSFEAEQRQGSLF